MLERQAICQKSRHTLNELEPFEQSRRASDQQQHPMGVGMSQMSINSADSARAFRFEGFFEIPNFLHLWFRAVAGILQICRYLADDWATCKGVGT